ncbi:MAG: hypothetical protein RI924_383, partial [Bacteroidota bacterium]
MILPRKLFHVHWQYIFANTCIAGLMTGLAVASFHAVVYGISFMAFWGILLFSLFHAFAMAYTISLYTEVLNHKISCKWIKVPALCLLGLVGTVAATELSYFLYAQIFNEVYWFLQHGNQILINYSISIIASAVVLLYESQRITYSNQFHKKEIEILKLKQLKMKEELEAIQSTINPHFLYNSLNTIAALVYDQATLAEDLTLKLSKLFRYSINYGQQNFSSIQDELEMVSVYLDIEKIRLGDRLSFKISVPPGLKKQFIPRFLLQPLVENALRHGLIDLAQEGEIEISIQSKGKNLVIGIYDNGKAFPQQVVSGQGFQSTYEKLELLYPKQYEFKLITKPKKQVYLLVPQKHTSGSLDLIQGAENYPSIK